MRRGVTSLRESHDPPAEPKCASVDSKTSTCTNITQLPKLTTFIVYASHPGGWPSGDTASATLTFADGTKQTEVFWVD